MGHMDFTGIEENDHDALHQAWGYHMAEYGFRGLWTA